MPPTATKVSPVVQLQRQIYREARAARPLPHLAASLLDRRNLEAAWERVRSTDGANTPGVDGATADEIRGQLAPWLSRLADDLLHRRYRPAAIRWVEIPKPNKPGQFRRLGILTLRDRLVHAALKQVLEPVLDPVFLPSSYGFRPGRSVAGALADATRLLSGTDAVPAYTQVAHLDVADCFDTLDHRHLLQELRDHVGDADVLRLVELIMQAGGTLERGWFRSRWRGLVQGSALSPLLCNLALHPLDEALAEVGRAHQDGLRLLRYADDLLLLARDGRLLERGVQGVREQLAHLHQKLRDTPGPRPATEGVGWLGVRLQPRTEAWAERLAYGYVVPDDKVRSMFARIREITTPPSERLDPSVFNLARWLVSINEQLRDWRQVYAYADNAPAVFAALDDLTRERVAELLHAVTGTRRAVLYEQYRVRLPRGFWTWEVAGTRLVVLSSLAPLAPANLIRRPVWTTRQADEPPSAPAAGS